MSLIMTHLTYDLATHLGDLVKERRASRQRQQSINQSIHTLMSDRGWENTDEWKQDTFARHGGTMRPENWRQVSSRMVFKNHTKFEVYKTWQWVREMIRER